MGSVSPKFFSELRETLNLVRAVETGTFEGSGTIALAQVFPSVVTIELSEFCYSRVKGRLDPHSNVVMILGDSREALPPLIRADMPTLYFLDGHWCEGPDGANDQCPIIEELAAMSDGHPDDCIIVDDARFLLSAPPPPYNPSHWPTLLQVIDAIKAAHPQHHITLLNDQIIAVPTAARSVVDRFGAHLAQSPVRSLRRQLLGQALGPWSAPRRALRHYQQVAWDRLQRSKA